MNNYLGNSGAGASLNVNRRVTRSTAAASVSSTVGQNKSLGTKPPSTASSSSTIKSTKNPQDAEKHNGLVAWLQKLLDPVLQCNYLGDPSFPMRQPIRLNTNEIRSTAPPSMTESKRSLGDQFQLIIPYADDSVKWAFSFCYLDPSLPPDMYFDDASFRPQYWDFEEFYNWNPYASVDCLLKLIRLLVAAYRKHHTDICDGHSRLNLELSMLPEAGFRDGSFEVCVYQAGARRGDVVFVFPIKTDALADLPAHYVDRQSSGGGPVYLKIRFTSLGDGKVHADLVLTPLLNKLMQGKPMRLPRMECFITEYVAEVQKVINDEIRMIGTAFQFRRRYMSALVASLPSGSLIHMDSAEFVTAAFLLDREDFQFLLKVMLPARGAITNSSIQFQLSSIYHEDTPNTAKKTRLPITSQSFCLAPRNPIVTLEDMAARTESFIDEKIAEFKKKSVQQGM